MDLKNRIFEALETELGRIYQERGITTGDISPGEYLAWEAIVDSATALFEKLIEDNK